MCPPIILSTYDVITPPRLLEKGGGGAVGQVPPPVCHANQLQIQKRLALLGWMGKLPRTSHTATKVNLFTGLTRETLLPYIDRYVRNGWVCMWTRVYRRAACQGRVGGGWGCPAAAAAAAVERDHFPTGITIAKLFFSYDEARSRRTIKATLVERSIPSPRQYYYSMILCT